MAITTEQITIQIMNTVNAAKEELARCRTHHDHSARYHEARWWKILMMEFQRGYDASLERGKGMTGREAFDHTVRVLTPNWHGRLESCLNHNCLPEARATTTMLRFVNEVQEDMRTA